MSDATENVAYRYCMCCGVVLEPDTNGPCDCGRPSAMIGLMKRRIIPMREVPEHQLDYLKFMATAGIVGMLALGVATVALARMLP